MNKAIIMSAAAVAALATAGCGSSPATAGSAQTSSGITQPGAPSPALTIPPDAAHQQVGNTQITAWCLVQKSTDENGNPLDAAEIYFDNTGRYDAEMFTVDLDLYDAAGHHVHTMNGDLGGHDDDMQVSDDEMNALEVPPGISTFGGLAVLEQTQNAGYEIPGNVQTCTVASIP